MNEEFVHKNVYELEKRRLEEKIEQIAKLISGGKVTEKQLEYAKEMVLEN